jgi:hypothetical protein
VLGNPAQHGLPSTTKLLGDKPQPRGKLPSLRKGFGVTNRGDHGGGGDRSYAFDLHQPLGGLTLPSQLRNLPVMTRDPFI